MTLLDALLPKPRSAEIHRIEIPGAPPGRVWEAVRHGELGHSRAIRALFALRELPERLAGSAHHPEPAGLRVDALVSTPERPGFQVLAEDPPHEVAVGAIGKVWHLEIPFVHVPDAEALAQFAEPDYAKVAWALRVVPTAKGDGSIVEVEVRVDATDDEAWKKFQRYFLVIGPASRFIRRTALRQLARELGTSTADGAHDVGGARDVVQGVSGAAIMALAMVSPFMRRARSHWGLDAAEAARSLPGDDLVQSARWGWTHGVEIDAPPERVWPWVAQIGAKRAGFYSYQWLENLVGCGVHNADAIHPEWEVRLGDELYLHPERPPLWVVRVERGRYFVAHAPASPRVVDRDPSSRPTDDAPWAAVSWLFMLEPVGTDRCRFISRYRADYGDGLGSRLAFGPGLLEPVGFAMDRRMLLGVKERVEPSRARTARGADAH